jgi:hypothetical protein
LFDTVSLPRKSKENKKERFSFSFFLFLFDNECGGALVLVFVWDLGIYCYFDLGVEFSIVKVLCWRLLALICFYFIRLV